MAKTLNVLSLGTRSDAKTWRDEAHAQLGYQWNSPVIEPMPSLEEISAFFGKSDDWLFFGGHFQDSPEPRLFNEQNNCSIEFESGQVTVHARGEQAVLTKGDQFKQHLRVKAIFWGGCNVATQASTVRALRSLFGNTHLMIGWIGQTGWEVLSSLMGEFGNAPPHANQDFFKRILGNDTDSVAVRQAWMGTALDTTWGSHPINDRVSVIAPDGQEWLIRNHRITKGRRF